MRSKWIINLKGLELFRFGENRKLYKLPYTNKGRSYGLREMKLQDTNRGVLDGKPYSKRVLKSHLELDPNPIELFKDLEEMPF